MGNSLLDRRKLLLRSGQVVLTAQVLRWGFSGVDQVFSLRADNDYIVGGLTIDRRSRLPDIVKRDVEQDHFLVAIDEKTGLIREVPVPFAPHSILIHPTKHGRVLGVPNNGMLSEVCEVDLIEGRVTRIIPSKHQHGFYGHGMAIPEKNIVVLVEFESDQSTAISIRDATSYQEVGRYTNFPTSPHSISMAPGQSRELAMVCFVDSVHVVEVMSGRTVHKFMVDDASQRLAHLEFGMNGETIVLANAVSGAGSNTRVGKIFRTKAGGDLLIPLVYPRQLFGEALSSAVDRNTGTMLVTHQDCDTISVWDLSDFSCLETLELKPRPRGVVFDSVANHFVISNINAHFFDYSRTHTLERLSSYAPNSSHFIRTRFHL